MRLNRLSRFTLAPLYSAYSTDSTLVTNGGSFPIFFALMSRKTEALYFQSLREDASAGTAVLPLPLWPTSSVRLCKHHGLLVPLCEWYYKAGSQAGSIGRVCERAGRARHRSLFAGPAAAASDDISPAFDEVKLAVQTKHNLYLPAASIKVI